LETDLELIRSTHNDETLTIDFISNENRREISDIIQKAGFRKYTSLIRMSSFNIDRNLQGERDQNLFYADESFLSVLEDLFKLYFDPFCEQIPQINELKEWINNKGLIIYSNDEIDIQGFIIFELTGQTAYLRYWFVHPNYRNMGVGSALIRKFFSDCKDSKRQLFWVIESNQNAIMRYSHFGFSKETLVNTLFINKEYKYEGTYN
jgi:ribosomal protein S18 acetylase RimI-like enzyme